MSADSHSRDDAPCPGDAHYQELPMPARIVVVGDLNGHAKVLHRILVGLRLIRKDGHWRGGRSVLVQMGDITNRGYGVRESMELLLKLKPEAEAAGGRVIWLLGNHEVMSVLRYEAYVTADEYLEFATEEEQLRFQEERTRTLYRLLGCEEDRGPVKPFGGRLQAWEEEHAPGQAAYHAAMGIGGIYGQIIRKLPIVVRIGRILFVHGGLSPIWAAYGLEGISRLARKAWARKPKFYQDLDPQGVLRDPLGPLWHRAYCVSSARAVAQDLVDALTLVDCRQMVVGHTRTDSAPKGETGVPLARHRGRLLMSDVGLGDPGEPGAALVIERGRVESWYPGGARRRIARVLA